MRGPLLTAWPSLLGLALGIVGSTFYVATEPPRTGSVIAILAAWSFAFVASSIRRKNAHKPYTLTAAAACLTLLAAEFWYAPPHARANAFAHPVRRLWASIGGGYGKNTYHRLEDAHVRDDDLGYASRPDVRVRAKEKMKSGQELKFDVIYTIDAFGNRVIPDNGSTKALLFFGCSFTFGQGVEDDEAYPAQVQKMFSGALKSVSYAFIGYGPHQTLRLLEQERERPALATRRPVRAFYLAMQHHVDRVGGLGGWGWYGPRYRLDADGNATYRGHLYPLGFVVAWEHLNKSFLLRRLGPAGFIKHLASQSSAREQENIDVFASVLKAVSDRLRTRYGIDLAILAWWQPWDHKRSPMERALRARGLSWILAEDLTEVGPNLYKDPRWTLPDGDDHPSALAHRAIAAGIFRNFGGDRIADFRGRL